VGELLAASENAEAELESLAVEDLWLALACAENHPAALQAFEREYGGELTTALRKMRIPAERHDDWRQQIRQKLFVGGADRAPRILDYSGRGRLRHWVRVALVRSLLDELRRDRRSPKLTTDEPALELRAPDADAEVEFLKRRYAHEFQTAFEEAVVGLDPDDRNALRSHYTHRMSIDQIAVAFGIHRATAARRVTRARERLVELTRERLQLRLAVETCDMNSVYRLLQSQVDLSVARLLA
jgi:RNA polymerase sigma-70 factor (ECF subfamily)